MAANIVPAGIAVGNRRQGLVAPGAPSPGVGSQQGFAAALHPRNVANQGELLSHGKITKHFVMQRPTDANVGTLIRLGQQLFIRRDKDAFTEAGALTADNQPHHFSNLWMYNTQMRAETEVARRLFNDLEVSDPRNPWLRYYRAPEELHAELYEKGIFSPVFNDKIGRHLVCLSKIGQRTLWNMCGVSAAHTAPDTNVQNQYAYLPILTYWRGVLKQENVWGREAAHGSKVFYVHKRIQHPFTKKWDFIGFQPVATIEDFPHAQQRRYVDFGGNVAWGDVHYAGIISDSLGESLVGEALLKIQGLHPECSAAEEYLISRDVPIVDVIYQPKTHGKYFTSV